MKRADAEVAARAVESITIPEVGADVPDRQGMDLLAAHVPLTLLLDLARAPESERILRSEVPSAEELAWLMSAAG